MTIDAKNTLDPSKISNWIFFKFEDRPNIRDLRKLLGIKRGKLLKRGGKVDLLLDLVGRVNYYMSNTYLSVDFFDSANYPNYVFNFDESPKHNNFLKLKYSENIIASYVASPKEIQIIGLLHERYYDLAVSAQKAHNFLESLHEDLLEACDANTNEFDKNFPENPFDELQNKIKNFYEPKLAEVKLEIIDWHNSHVW
jgi:hypothetical protein